MKLRRAKRKDAKAEYDRKYRAEHVQEKVERDKHYYEEHKEQIRAAAKQYRINHQEWKIEYDRAYQQEHKEQKQEYDKRWRYPYEYGITSEQKECMWLNQGKACAMCHRAQPLWGTKGINVDHNHGTGQVRGLLCKGCNGRVGKVEDKLLVGLSPEPYSLSEIYYFYTPEQLNKPWMQMTIGYLEYWEAPHLETAC